MHKDKPTKRKKKRQNYSGVKYGKNTTERSNGEITWKKNFKDFKEAVMRKYSWFHVEQVLNRKTLGQDGIHGFWFKKSNKPRTVS